mgnify:CR=1 FL=1
MKSFLATFIGLIAAFVIMMALEILGHVLFPLPVKLSTSDAEAIAKNFHLIPIGAYLSVVFAHGIGLLIGLIIARAIDKETLYAQYLLAGFLLLGTIANLAQIPHPLWFTIADVGVVLAIGALVIYNAHKKRTQN